MSDTPDTGSAEPLEAASSRSCGTCTLCCELPLIEALSKPEGELCKHAMACGGCGIYAARPPVCREFHCLWLQHPAFDAGWKPDVCHFFVIQVDERMLTIAVDPKYPDAWRRSPYYEQIKIWSEVIQQDRGQVLVYVGPQMWAIFPEEDIDAGLKTVGGRIAMGYLREGPVRRPCVALTAPDGTVETITGRLYRGMPDDPPELRGPPVRGDKAPI